MKEINLDERPLPDRYYHECAMCRTQGKKYYYAVPLKLLIPLINGRIESNCVCEACLIKIDDIVNQPIRDMNKAMEEFKNRLSRGKED